MSKWKRVNRYYFLERRGHTIWITHFPRSFFYFANKQTFFRERRNAYRKVAALLQNNSFWPKTKQVVSRSLTIDFTKETNRAIRVKPQFYDRVGLLLLWLMNVYNWRISRMKKGIKVIGSPAASQISLSRNEFIEVYGRGR